MRNEEMKDLVETASKRVDDYRRFKQLGLIPLDDEFFPFGVHYPPITMYPEMSNDQFFGSYTLPADGKLDIYVHIPFCIQQCVFCHYPSLYKASEAEKDRYLGALEKEMDIFLARFGLDKIKVRSILMGGGTPTDLTPKQLERFLKYFTKRCDMSEIEQFNYDTDPGTVVGPEGIERMRIMRDYGVDRQTLGVQSLNPQILKKMHRTHNVEQALESIKVCRDFNQIVNLEFIFGYPGQTIENWIELLEMAVASDPDELQFYRLKIIPYGDQDGEIEKVRAIKPEEIPPGETSILMKAVTIEYLERLGWQENLRRVFTRDKKKFISKYAFNQCCDLKDQVGFGLSAFSSFRDRFGISTPGFKDYYEAIDKGLLPLNRGVIRTPEEQARWATVLPLKNSWIRKRVFAERTGLSLDNVFRPKIELLKEHGLIEETERKIELTKLGSFFADEVCMQFSGEEYLPFDVDAYTHGPLNPRLSVAQFDEACTTTA